MDAQTRRAPRAISKEQRQPISSLNVPAALREITRIIADWCAEHSVRLCVVFGSQASGRTHLHSDVDLAVWPAGPISSAERLHWLRELETALDRRVSLVLVSSTLDPVLGFELVRQGHLAFEREPGLWATQRARLWHAYNDSLPFRRATRQRLEEFAEEVRRDT